MQGKRILITGGAGFIGSHLAEAMIAAGNEVTVIDDLSTGKWRNISALEGTPNFRAIIESAANQNLLEAEVPKHDLVYHLASAVGVKLIIQNPVHTVEVIFRTTDTVLKACSKYRRPVLITSTSEVYGKSEAIPFEESADVVMGATEKRRWAYACAKALDEFLALAHYYETQLPVFIARLFNTVGPRQSSQYGMVLPTFVEQALAGRPITVFGDGSQRRCFCSVSDVVRGLSQLPLTPGAAGMVVNFGSEEEISMCDLAKTVKKLCRSRSEIVFTPYEAAYGPGFDDMPRRVPSLARARRLLNWSPRYTLEEIILMTAEFISANSPAPAAK
jgi:UDP-glucose 4-epimerase